MVHPHRILVAAQNTGLASTLVTWLGEARHEFALVTSFAAAKFHMGTLPDLLITEVKLGEHNGMHLALRARAAGIPTLVLGVQDPMTEREAAQVGAEYLAVTGLDGPEFQARVDTLLESHGSTVQPDKAERASSPSDTLLNTAIIGPLVRH